VITLGCLLLWIECLENITHKGWLEAPTTLSPFLNIKLGIVYIKDYRDSWMKTISNSFLFSKIISMSSLFFQTFYEKIFRSFKIMN